VYGRHFVKKLVVSDTVERFGEIDVEDVDIGVSIESMEEMVCRRATTAAVVELVGRKAYWSEKLR